MKRYSFCPYNTQAFKQPLVFGATSLGTKHSVNGLRDCPEAFWNNVQYLSRWSHFVSIILRSVLCGGHFMTVCILSFHMFTFVSNYDFTRLAVCLRSLFCWILPAALTEMQSQDKAGPPPCFIKDCKHSSISLQFHFSHVLNN